MDPNFRSDTSEQSNLKHKQVSAECACGALIDASVEDAAACMKYNDGLMEKQVKLSSKIIILPRSSYTKSSMKMRNSLFLTVL